jgi:hypothetical protein
LFKVTRNERFNGSCNGGSVVFERRPTSTLRPSLLLHNLQMPQPTKRSSHHTLQAKQPPLPGADVSQRTKVRRGMKDIETREKNNFSVFFGALPVQPGRGASGAVNDDDDLFKLKPVTQSKNHCTTPNRHLLFK